MWARTCNSLNSTASRETCMYNTDMVNREHDTSVGLQRGGTFPVSIRKPSMGTSSWEFRKYSKFEIYREFMGIHWKCIILLYTNILFDHRVACKLLQFFKIYFFWGGWWGFCDAFKHGEQCLFKIEIFSNI